MDLGQYIDRYQECLAVKAELAQQTKDCNKDTEEAKQELINAMVEAEMDGVTRDGYSFALVPKTKYSKKAEDGIFFSILKAHDLGGLIHETVNANSLQGAMSNLASENEGELPEDVLDVINVYEFMDISRRKK